MNDDRLDIHTWFNLTYAAYLVLPRTLLQEMPEDWQLRFTEMVDEIEATFDLEKIDGYVASYQVTAAQGDGSHRYVKDPLRNYRHPIALPRRERALVDTQNDRHEA